MCLLSQFAFRIEADSRKLRNKALEDLEKRNELQARIQHETKRRNREVVIELKARLEEIGPEVAPSQLKMRKEKVSRKAFELVLIPLFDTTLTLFARRSTRLARS